MCVAWKTSIYCKPHVLLTVSAKLTKTHRAVIPNKYKNTLHRTQCDSFGPQTTSRQTSKTSDFRRNMGQHSGPALSQTYDVNKVIIRWLFPTTLCFSYYIGTEPLQHASVDTSLMTDSLEGKDSRAALFHKAQELDSSSPTLNPKEVAKKLAPAD